MLNNLQKLGKRNAKRLGRGLSSGKGRTCSRGTKGQKSRSGHNIPRRFEGGQVALIQRLPKVRGFKSRKVKPTLVKYSVIEKNFPTTGNITPKDLVKKGLIADSKIPVKIVLDKEIKIKYKFLSIALTKKILANSVK